MKIIIKEKPIKLENYIYYNQNNYNELLYNDDNRDYLKDIRYYNILVQGFHELLNFKDIIKLIKSLYNKKHNYDRLLYPFGFRFLNRKLYKQKIKKVETLNTSFRIRIYYKNKINCKIKIFP